MGNVNTVGPNEAMVVSGMFFSALYLLLVDIFSSVQSVF